MESQQSALWAVLFATFIPATVSLFFRLVGRWLTKSKFWWDDYTAIACYVMAITWLIVLPIWINKGLGLHITDIKETTEQIFFDSKLCLFIIEFIYGFALFFAKISILCLYWRLFKVANVALPIQILIGCTIVWIILRTFIGIFHCVPVQYFWDTSIEDGYCAIDDRKFFIGSMSAHVLTDILVLLLPIFQIQKLNLPILQRLGVIVMFMFGIFTCVVGIVTIVVSINMGTTSNDFTWNCTTIILWATVEVNLVNISSNIPTVKPAIYYIFNCGGPLRRLADNRETGIYCLSQSKKSIMMTNMRNNHHDDASSTYQLADSVHSSSGGDFDNHAIDRPEGVKTVIESQHTEKDEELEYSDDPNMDGIRVKNETIIQVSKSKEEQAASPFSVADDDFV
ncbi:hypothetical protein F5X99DRAFT_328986 [Biscogniauxia marginata]|nr:hypothetical protein F5X99DRAFT_328986 [Biscogniauxia marginata]